MSVVRSGPKAAESAAKALRTLLLAVSVAGSAWHFSAPPARAADQVPTLQDALALAKEGKRPEALRALEAIIASHPPDPAIALYQAATLYLDEGNWRDARRHARALVRLRPGSMDAWELMVQVDQVAGDKSDLRRAIYEVETAWRSAVDPAVRSRISFIRDRIVGPHRTVVVRQTLEPGGDEIVRFVAIPTDPGEAARHFMIVQSDGATNERWRDNGAVSSTTIVFHLDTVEAMAGDRQIRKPYEFYVDEPDYDRVRKTIVAILDGSAKPMAGTPDPFWTSAPEPKP